MRSMFDHVFGGGFPVKPVPKREPLTKSFEFDDGQGFCEYDRESLQIVGIQYQMLDMWEELNIETISLRFKSKLARLIQDNENPERGVYE